MSFVIAPGEAYGLLGPNGAGKTTTIRMVCGLLRPDAGDVLIDGRSPWADRRVKMAIGYVPQDIALYQDLTALENLRFVGTLYGLRGRALDAAAREALATVDLSERGDDRVESFSGGMKRRLNIAAGLVHRPQLLVLDEPTVGVDPQSRHAILDRVESFRERGMAVLYTTHYMEEAERVCDRVGIVDHGRLVAEGTRRELVARLGQLDRIELTAAGDLTAFTAACRDLPEVSEVSSGAGQVHLLAREGRRVLPSVLDLADHSGASVSSVEVVEPDLEAVFLHLTGTALRE
ncbi:MAG: ATP-binding cassette domain-containing protein [Ilumatobacteraceae bacterium]